MIILEGPDNSGKTTLGATLEANHRLTLHHSGGPVKPGTIEDRLGWMLKGLPPPHLLWDRFPCVSDVIFGNVLRGHTPIERQHIRLMVGYNPLFIYCRPPTDILLNMDNHRLGEHDSPEHLAGVMKNQATIVAGYDIYFDMLAAMGAAVARYDYTKTDIRDLGVFYHLAAWRAP